MAQDAETRTYYRIASHLGKSVREILNFPTEEIRGWVAYLSHETP